MPSLESVAEAFKVTNRHISVKPVGSGAFKQTFKLVKNDGKTVALKIYDPDNFNLERTQEEIKALLKCKSNHIARLYDYGVYTHGDTKEYFFTFEEYLDGGTLKDKIKANPLDIEFVRNLAYILVKAIIDLHTNQLVHRDIKPENIMFRKDSNDPFLVDFGLVRNLNRVSLTPTWAFSGPGTPYYSAPEQLNNQKDLIDWRTDQFSLGIVIAECLIGKHPFHSKGQNINAVVTSVAERRQCGSDVIRQMETFGFKWVVKMISPWPHQRFQSPYDLIAILERER